MEFAIIYNSRCNTVFNKTFLEVQGSWILLGEEKSFSILGSCEAYGKNGYGY